MSQSKGRGGARGQLDELRERRAVRGWHEQRAQVKVLHDRRKLLERRKAGAVNACCALITRRTQDWQGWSTRHHCYSRFLCIWIHIQGAHQEDTASAAA